MSGTPSPHSPSGPATPPVDPHEVHEWSAFYDPEGRIYYYNSVTEESSWDPPETFNPPPPKEEEKVPEAKKLAESDQQHAEEGEADNGQANDYGGAVHGTWEAYKDDQGREYYFNAETGETQWEKPVGMAEADAAVSAERQQSPPTSATSIVDGEAIGTKKEQKDATKQEEEQSVEEEVDPAVKAEKALNEPDAVMEPGRFDG